MVMFGCDMNKWFITKTRATDGRWHICPPTHDSPNWSERGGSSRGGPFATGAEALAVFAQGQEQP